MSLLSWLRNGNAHDQRLLLALQNSEDVDRLYAQWREDRVADFAPAPVVPITAARGHRHAALIREQRRTVEQASGLSGAGRPSDAPGPHSAPSTPAEPSHHFNKNAAPASCPSPDAA